MLGMFRWVFKTQNRRVQEDRADDTIIDVRPRGIRTNHVSRRRAGVGSINAPCTIRTISTKSVAAELSDRTFRKGLTLHWAIAFISPTRGDISGSIQLEPPYPRPTNVGGTTNVPCSPRIRPE
jgi:hypothetical protein